ncbi:MAG: cyclic pyranopterin monophosphate synthase MoaC [Chlorobi bacterium]|nr:cyclic pyranopterin monophosphate synthase MoaC [Chlorobiota bacterium]
MTQKLTHVDNRGNARMVDVSNKPIQMREARATGEIKLLESTCRLIRDNQIKKGDVLTVARIAGIQAAKNTAGLIPLCHPLNLDGIEVNCTVDQNRVIAESRIKTTGKTGVEMEALTAVSVALLTVYDMCKAVDNSMEIGKIRLLEKIKKDI